MHCCCRRCSHLQNTTTTCLDADESIEPLSRPCPSNLVLQTTSHLTGSKNPRGLPTLPPARRQESCPMGAMVSNVTCPCGRCVPVGGGQAPANRAGCINRSLGSQPVPRRLLGVHGMPGSDAASSEGPCRAPPHATRARQRVTSDGFGSPEHTSAVSAPFSPLALAKLSSASPSHRPKDS